MSLNKSSIHTIARHLRRDVSLRFIQAADVDPGRLDLSQQLPPQIRPNDGAGDDDSEEEKSGRDENAESEDSAQEDAIDGSVPDDDEEVSSGYDSDVNMWDDVDGLQPDVDEFTIINTFAKMMIDGIANRRITQTGADFVLATLHDTLLTLLAPHVRAHVARDWRGLKSEAGQTEQDHWCEHFCPKNHPRFDRDSPDDEHCLISRQDTRYKKGNTMLCVSVRFPGLCIEFVLVIHCIAIVHVFASRLNA